MVTKIKKTHTRRSFINAPNSGSRFTDIETNIVLLIILAIILLLFWIPLTEFIR